MRLTARQEMALRLLAAALPLPGMTIRPGYEYDRWLAVQRSFGVTMDCGMLQAPAQQLERKGLTIVTGVPYGPKTYELTDEGRAAAAALSERTDG